MVNKLLRMLDNKVERLLGWCPSGEDRFFSVQTISRQSVQTGQDKPDGVRTVAGRNVRTTWTNNEHSETVYTDTVRTNGVTDTETRYCEANNIDVQKYTFLKAQYWSKKVSAAKASAMINKRGYGQRTCENIYSVINKLNPSKLAIGGGV